MYYARRMGIQMFKPCLGTLKIPYGRIIVLFRRNGFGIDALLPMCGLMHFSKEDVFSGVDKTCRANKGHTEMITKASQVIGREAVLLSTSFKIERVFNWQALTRITERPSSSVIHGVD